MATNVPRNIWSFCIAAVRRFEDDHGFQTAASLAFTTLLAIVPIITVALALASAWPVFDSLVETLRRLAVEHFLPQTGGVEAVTAQLAAFRANAARLTLIGLGLIVLTAVMLLLTVDNVFNRIYRVQRPRPLTGRVLAYLLVLLVGPVLIGGSLSATSFLVGRSLGMVGDVGGLTPAVLAAIPFAFTFVALALLYLLVPSRRVAPRHAIIGAVLAGVTFEIAKRGFAWYIAQFPTYAIIYGAFAVLPIFLLWVYVSWVVVLAGAIVTAMLGEKGAGSMTSIARRERLIVALDVPAADQAKALVERIGDAAAFYKIGLELSTSSGYFELLEWLAARGNKVFADLKFYDIPETVRRAVANLSGRGATFLTVHGHRSILQAAASAKGPMKILAVTVLTSFDERDLKEMGAAVSVEELVLARARGTLETGCDGVIASGLEAPKLKAEFGDRLLVVTPGIRPLTLNRPADDQKRTVDVAQAFANGADYIVVGRPVRDAPDPRAAAQAIQNTIAGIFSD